MPSCFAKGLEIIVTNRMSQLEVIYDVVGKQKFGAIPKRSATDLASCVVHDIEAVRSQRWALSFITLDVQGVFDAALHNKLVWRMHHKYGRIILFNRWLPLFQKGECKSVSEEQ